MRPPCDKYEPEFSAFLDGELDAGEHARVAHHVEKCRACAAAVARLEGVSQALRRWDAGETRYTPSHAFRNRVIESVRDGALHTAPSGSPTQ